MNIRKKTEKQLQLRRIMKTNKQLNSNNLNSQDKYN